MSSSRNNHPHSRYEISIQADPQDLHDALHHPHSLTLRPSKPQTQAIAKLMQDLSQPKPDAPAKAAEQ